MAVKVLNFHPRHLEVMEVREYEAAWLGNLKGAYAKIEQLTKDSVQAGTFMYDGRVLFCAGFSWVGPGVLEVWMIPSMHAKEASVFFGRTIKRLIESIARDFKAHRIQTTSNDDAFHERWMEWLGFQKEGTMRQFTHDKKNMCVYARLFPVVV